MKKELKNKQQNEVDQYFTKEQQIALKAVIVDSIKLSFSVTGTPVPELLLTTQAMNIADKIVFDAAVKLAEGSVFEKFKNEINPLKKNGK